MLLHLPANHPHADTPEWTPITGVTFVHGEAEITAPNAAGLGRMLALFYGVEHGAKPEGGAARAELPNVVPGATPTPVPALKPRRPSPAKAPVAKAED